jgi:hypothetical protein
MGAKQYVDVIHGDGKRFVGYAKYLNSSIAPKVKPRKRSTKLQPIKYKDFGFTKSQPIKYKDVGFEKSKPIKSKKVGLKKTKPIKYKDFGLKKSKPTKYKVQPIKYKDFGFQKSKKQMIHNINDGVPRYNPRTKQMGVNFTQEKTNRVGGLKPLSNTEKRIRESVTNNHMNINVKKKPLSNTEKRIRESLNALTNNHMNINVKKTPIRKPLFS